MACTAGGPALRSLGREVRNYTELGGEWEDVGSGLLLLVNIVIKLAAIRPCFANPPCQPPQEEWQRRITANRPLYDQLLLDARSASSVYVAEGAKDDTRCGIGFHATHPELLENIGAWGRNQLGHACMVVSGFLKDGDASDIHSDSSDIVSSEEAPESAPAESTPNPIPADAAHMAIVKPEYRSVRAAVWQHWKAPAGEWVALSDVLSSLTEFPRPASSKETKQWGQYVLRSLHASPHLDTRHEGKPSVRRTLASAVKVDKRGCRVEIYDGTSSISGLGAGDSYYVCSGIANPERCMTAVSEEVAWGRLYSKGNAVPREVALQGAAQGDGAPVYRHAVDFHPPLETWTNVVGKIVEHAEKVTGETLNHGTIQRYRDGTDSTALHSHKTLDIKHGSSVVTVSLGATRKLILRSKDGRVRQEIALADGSLYLLGWKTNVGWLHGVPQSPNETVVGPRVSLTLRNIATFVLPDGTLYGQGATQLSEEAARAAIKKQQKRLQNWDRVAVSGSMVVFSYGLNEVGASVKSAGLLLMCWLFLAYFYQQTKWVGTRRKWKAEKKRLTSAFSEMNKYRTDGDVFRCKVSDCYVTEDCL
eukprot:TRINITY_DN14119_c0_g1_i3.p1 TRINITY_DN14119_c0_g1~~TRINITY_DN14119_c0_g1_i3.p1  ORF type:complete len:590 (+),score=110.82 TRINITY_DN14119_c0_g1_i3:1-1770(+)